MYIDIRGIVKNEMRIRLFSIYAMSLINLPEELINLLSLDLNELVCLALTCKDLFHLISSSKHIETSFCGIWTSKMKRWVRSIRKASFFNSQSDIVIALTDFNYPVDDQGTTGSYLHTLSLGLTPITGVSYLAKYRSLRNIFLNATLVRDISPLADLPLQSLHINDTRVLDIEPLSKCVSLRNFSMKGTLVSDISPLSKLSLDTLDIDVSDVIDISPLENMTSLTNLSMNRTKIVDITPLAKLTGVQELLLCSVKISNVNVLQGFEGLKKLDISHTHVSDLSPLKDINLEYLDIRWTSVVDLARLSFPSLTYLNINGTKIEDISHLQCKSLRILFMMFTNISNISMIDRFDLRYIDIRGSLVEDTSVFKKCPKLSTIFVD